MKGIKGFTAIELIITLVVASLVLAIGIPGFLNMLERNTVSTTSNELLSGLLLARNEAVRQGRGSSTLTPSTSGWTVESWTEDSGTTNLLTHRVDNSNITITGAAISYNARGRASLENTQSIEISFDGTVKSRICLSLTGRPYILSADDGVCP
jgi:type IV fimbrial biogenesis protein FimT